MVIEFVLLRYNFLRNDARARARAHTHTHSTSNSGSIQSGTVPSLLARRLTSRHARKANDK